MKGSCPLKTNPDWVESEKVLGENNTWKLWMDSSTGDILPPIKGAFYFYTNQKPKEAAKLLETYIPAGLRANFNNATRVTDMLDAARAEMFKDPAYLTWLKTQDYYDKFEADVQELIEKQQEEKYKETPIEELEKVPQGVNFMEKIDPVDLINRIRNVEILNTLTQASLSIGIDFKMMSAEEAKTELKGKYVGYNGQPLVLLINKLIYIPENISSNTQLADLMIPFITSLRRSKKNVFNIQYNKIISSNLGQTLLERAKQKNPDASYDNEYFQELVVLEALREDANLKRIANLSQAAAEKVDPLFKEAITAIVAHTRESIRSKIPGIKQTSINTTTTLEEFGKLVENVGKKFSTEGITSSDIAKYNQEIQQGVDEITAAVNSDQSLAILNNIIQNFIKTNSKQLGEIKDNIYFDIRQSLSDESGRFLRDIAERLKYFKKENADVYDFLDNSFRAKALVSSLLTLNKTLDKILEFLKGLDGKQLSVEELAEKVAHYNYLMQSWGNFVETTRRNLKEMGVAEESTVYGFLARLNSKIEDGAAIAKKLNNNVATEHIAMLLGDFSTKQKKYYEDQIAELKKQSPSSKRDKQIKELEEKKEKYNFTKDKVNKLFRGELGDANFWSSMFESYTTNPDPVIASFALFIKGHTQDILNTAITKSTKFTEKIKPLMARLGMTNIDHKKDWEPFLMVDLKPMRREDGTLDSQKVLTFMSAVKEWRYGLAKFDDAINTAEKSGDKEALKKAILDKEEHLNNFFNRKYKREFYEARAQLAKENPDAFKALEDINVKIEEFRNEHKDDIDFFMNNSELDTLYKEKQRLYSIYNEDGSLKDEANRKIAVALYNHRIRMKRFYTSEEKKGAFQRSLDGFIAMAEKSSKIAEEYKIEKYYDEEGNPTPEFQAAIDEWINQNTSVAYSDTYYEEIDKIYTEIGEISKLLPEEYRTDELYKKRNDILIGFKDEYGQPNPNEMGTSKDKRMAELKSIQEQIDKIQKKADSEFFSKNPDLKNKFNEAIAKLTTIKFNEPTEYYLQEINSYLAAVNGPSLDTLTANDFLTKKDNVEKIEKFKKQYPDFAKWFDANHIKKESISSTGKQRVTYERLFAWSVPKIEGDQYYVQTAVKIGNKTINISRKPNSKYYFTKVKDTYKTIKDEADRQSKIGTVVTNRGEYLPLNKEQFIEQGREAEIVNSPYINHQYYSAIKDSTYKQLLDATKEYHLSNQLGLDRDQKLYMDLPRYPISSVLEKSQRGILFTRWTDRLKSITAGIRATLSGASVEEANIASAQLEDVAEEFVNPEVEKEQQEFSMLEDGIINPVLDKIPIRGIQNLPIERTSYDVIAALNLYMLQTEKQKLFNKISPLAQAVMQTLDDVDGGVAKINGIKGAMANMSNAAKNLTTGKDQSVRAAAFRSFFNREFKGQMYSEKHLDWLNKVTSAITGGASINYFALNLPSAIKNYWGMLWQMNVEAVAGEYFDFGSMAKGKLRSKTAMAEWTTRIWGGTYNTIDTQMIIRFDPIQGKAEEVIGKDPSRTFQKDLASISWVYSPRKFMEMEGGLQLFYSMMYHHKVKNENGKQTNISYADAWELDKEGRMVLKKGIHPDYGITYNEDGTSTLGKEFKKFQNAVHEKFKDLNGAFAKFEQPQAQMFFAYRLFAFMRRYFTAMFMNRFGSERANFALETVRTGYYIEALQSLGKIIMSLGMHAGQLAPSERRALFKTLVDVIQIVAISAIASMLFGWDDDDEDRFEKLRAKSGALGEDDFRLDGWLSNHALTLLIKTQAENQSFIPLPGLGLNNYIDFTSSTSIAFGPTITSGAKLLTDIAQHAMPGDNEDLYYKRDTGPYSWQKEGEAKIWNHFFSMVGFSGSQVSPVKGLESFEAQSRQ